MEYTVSLSSEEEKALSTEMVSIQAWLDNAIHNRASQAIDSIVQEYSDRQPSKIPNAEKLQIVRDAEVETAIERNARIEQEISDAGK